MTAREWFRIQRGAAFGQDWFSGILDVTARVVDRRPVAPLVFIGPSLCWIVGPGADVELAHQELLERMRRSQFISRLVP